MTGNKKYLIWGGFGLFVTLLWAGLFFIAPVVWSYVAKSSDNVVERLAGDEAIQDGSIKVLIATQGMTKTLETMQKDIKVPYVIDDQTTLTKVEVKDTTLTYTYDVDWADDYLENRTEWIIDNTCIIHSFRTLFTHGATLQYKYRDKDLTPIGSIAINDEVCLGHETP